MTAVQVDAHGGGWLQAIVDSSDDAILGTTLDGIVVSWNPAAERMFGYPAAEVIGRSVALIVPEERLTERQRMLEHIRAGRPVERVLTRRRTRSGLEIDVSVAMSPVYVDGEVVGASVIARDITGELGRLESLRRDVGAYRLAFLSNPLPMWMYDVATGRMLAVNDAAVSRYGFSRDAFLRLTVEDLYPARERIRFRESVLKHPDTPTLGRRTQHLRADGGAVEVRESARPLRLATGPARLVLAEDISAEVAAARRARTSERELYASLLATIEAIAATVEQRDPYTAGHQLRVADLAVAIAERLGMAPDTVEGIRLAATIHDIGKIGLPAEILSYPGPLSEPMFELVKTHCQAGHDIVARIEFPWPIAQVILQHHERLDGSGYPQGLRDDQILMAARIVTVADVTEAMTAHRPYRPALGIDEALAELRRGRGTLYDPTVVDACIALFADEGFEFSHRDRWSP